MRTEPAKVLAWAAFLALAGLTFAGVWDAVTGRAVSDVQFTAAISLVATIVGGVLGAHIPSLFATKPETVADDEPVEVLPLTGPSLGAKLDQTPPIDPPSHEQVDLDQLWDRLSR